MLNTPAGAADAWKLLLLLLLLPLVLVWVQWLRGCQVG